MDKINTFSVNTLSLRRAGEIELIIINTQRPHRGAQIIIIKSNFLCVQENTKTERVNHGSSNGEHEQFNKWKGLALVAARGVSRVPAKQMLASRHRVQVRSSAGQCRGAEWTRDSLLRQHQGEFISKHTPLDNRLQISRNKMPFCIMSKRQCGDKELHSCSRYLTHSVVATAHC